MDPRQLFIDDRFKGACVYCGAKPTTKDHAPSKVFLDEPFPGNLANVDSCRNCNVGFSLDEQYLACFIECVVSGTIDLPRLKRQKIARILAETPALALRIAKSRANADLDNLIWNPEIERINSIVLKLARGHIAYEFGLLLTADEPARLKCAPINTLSGPGAERFLRSQPTPFWPEIGSRAFIRACKLTVPPGADNWHVVQPGRYRYLVSQTRGVTVRIVIRDYLACEVQWD